MDIKYYRLAGILMWCILLVVYACNNAPDTTTAENGSVKEKKIKDPITVDSILNKADSFVVVLYNNPFGDDSLRYTRSYKQVSAVDDSSFIIFNQQMRDSFTIQERNAACRTEGKIWVYGSDKIIQTVYFNTVTTGCSFVYLIKEGVFYYSKPTALFTDWILQLRPLIKYEEGEASQ